MAKKAKSLAQLKLDVKRSGWPWPIEHPNDERALLNGCYPDFRAAERVREFYFDLLCLPRQGGGVEPFQLLQWWYQRVLGPIFGWKKRDGRRRFDKGFITTAKKAAKTTTLSGLALYMTCADGEEEAECYSAATDKDQAGMIYKKAAGMVRRSPELSSEFRLTPFLKRISHESSNSFYEAISSDADSAEGKNPHLLIADELHVWKDRQFFNALMYGDIARTQPLFLMITTAGEDKLCVGFEEYEFAKDLLNPHSELYSESHFAFIAEKSDELEWDDPEGWQQANPSLAEGVGSVEKLQAKCEEAKRTPSKRREFIRYICNRWVDAVAAPWLSEEGWAGGGKKVPDHAGEPCWGALDLSRSVDLTAFTLAFLADDDCLDLLWWFWMPKAKVKRLEQRDRAPYRQWIEEGWITATPGRVVDYAYVRRTISGVMLDAAGQPLPERHPDRLDGKYELQMVGIDPWNATKLVTELHEYDGIPILEIRQGFASLNKPSKEFERLPEWAVPGEPEEDAFVWVRNISGKARDEFEASLARVRKKGVEITMENMRARLCVMAVVDDQDNLLFEEDDAGWLGNKSAAPLDRVYSTAKELSGMTDNDMEELRKNLNKIPSDDSSSD